MCTVEKTWPDISSKQVITKMYILWTNQVLLKSALELYMFLGNGSTGSYRNIANTCKHWSYELWETLILVWSILNRPLHSHIYLHDVEYQRPLTCSESLNGVEKCGTRFGSECTATEDSESGTWHNLPRWATACFPSRSPEHTHMQYMFAWEHIWTAISQSGTRTGNSFSVICMETNGSAAVFCTDFYYCMYFEPV